MKKFYEEICIALNNFICKLKKLREDIEKFNNYVGNFNDSLAFVMPLTVEQQRQIKVTIYNLSLKISSFDFDKNATDVVQLIDEMLVGCTAEHSTEINKSLVLADKFMEMYSESFSINICNYLKYINNLKVIQTNELMNKGILLIIVIDNITKKTMALLT